MTEARTYEVVFTYVDPTMTRKSPEMLYEPSFFCADALCPMVSAMAFAWEARDESL